MSSSSQNPETFKYENLPYDDSIRIFELQPSARLCAEIHGRLMNEELSKLDVDIVDHYTALSYVWGSTGELKPIFINGHPLKVTRNLRDALQALREPSRVIRVWADAICINQADVEERSRQVRMMESIYFIARHTVIYLGQSDGHIDALFEEIARIEVERRSDRHQASASRPRTVLTDFLSSSVFEPAARELLARPWFSRGWIFQELLISRDPWVQCGSSRIRWEPFCKYLQTRGMEKVLEAEDGSMEIMPEKRSGSSVSFKGFKHLDSARIAYQKGAIEGKLTIGLLDLLISPRRVEFTDPRDIIFGYMGVAKSPVIGEFSERYWPPPIVMSTLPDYGKSTAQVFNEFAADVIQTMENPEIFSYVEDLDLSLRRPGLASWAPDWTKYSSRNSQPMFKQSPRIPFFLRRPQQYGEHKENTLDLTVLGWNIFDKITHVSRVIPWSSADLINLGPYATDFSTDFEYLSLHTPRGLQMSRYRQICSLYSQAIGSQFLPESENGLDAPGAGTIEELQTCNKTLEGASKWSLTMGKRLSVSDFLFLHTFKKKKRSLLAGRRIAKFQSGRICVVPSAAQVNDTLAIFDDTGNLYSSACYIFRQISQNKTSHLADLPQYKLDELKDISERWYGRWVKLDESVQNMALVGECFVCNDASETWKAEKKESDLQVVNIR
jgi:hypothetical protein